MGTKQVPGEDAFPHQADVMVLDVRIDKPRPDQGVQYGTLESEPVEFLQDGKVELEDVVANNGVSITECLNCVRDDVLFGVIPEAVVCLGEGVVNDGAVDLRDFMQETISLQVEDKHYNTSIPNTDL